MIDVHAHLNFKAFKDDYREVIQRGISGGIKAIINIGSNFATSQRAVEIAREFKGCWAAVGLHPIHVGDEKFNEEKYFSLVQANKNLIKAIGETGLDYFHITHNMEHVTQKKVFREHLKLAKELSLPVILHCRGSKENPKDAYLEMLKALKAFYFLPSQLGGGFHGEIHCFSADWEIARKFLDLGAYIGFTGPITFKNADRAVLEVVKRTPLDKILAETDCPFLAPEPYRGNRNEPAYVRFIIEKIAEIKNLSFEETEKRIDRNAKELFRLH